MVDPDRRDSGHPLAGAEAPYRELAEAMPQLVWIARDDGVVTYYNDRVRLYAGIQPSAQATWSWAPAVHPEDLQSTGEAWDAAVRNQMPYECEHRVQMADGSYRWHISRALPVHDHEGEVTWFGTATDIHAQKQVEDDLRETSARFRAVFSSIDQGFCLGQFVFGPEDRPIDFRILEANQRFGELTGLSDTSDRLVRQLAPDLKPAWLEMGTTAAEIQEATRFEQYSEATGRWLEIHFAPVFPEGRVAVLLSDITARKHLELELRESEQRFRAMANNLPVLVWVHDREGKQQFVNDTFCEYFGVPREDMGEQRWRMLTHPEDGPGYSQEFDRCVSERRPFHGETRVKRGDGEWRWLESWAQPQFDADGTFRGHLGTSIDITDRKTADVALRQLHAEEHRVALELQHALLPGPAPAFPGVEIATRYVAATDTMEVGGDWYELYSLDDGRVGIVVGDVVGHGLEAAAAMGQLRAGFLALSTRTTDPAALLDELDVFTSRHRITDFATAVCVVFDPRTGALDYANAGHPPMLLVTPDGSAVWLDDARATPLGTGLSTVRPMARHLVEPASVLFMFTDGLVEDRHRPIQQGMSELAAVVTAQPLLTTDELCDVVLKALSPHQGFNDDVVVVCLRRLVG